MKLSSLVRLRNIPRADFGGGGVGLAVGSPFSLEQRRTVFWGHDTVEDQWERKREDQAKRIISWSNPNHQVGATEKKDFVWSPARIAAEANYAKGTPTTKYMTLTNWLSYATKNFWPQWVNFLFFPTDFREKNIKNYYAYLVESQEFIKERLLMLGPDLAAAHFLCHNNCRVRFRGHKDWTELTGNGVLDIPAKYVKGWHVEAIDCSSSRLVYEGLQNLRNLHHLKYLDVSYCQYFDVWCLDRVTGEYCETLEYLDISGCRQLDWNGLEILWRCRNLKTLVLRDMGHVRDLNLICLLLLDVNPKLKILGADYIDVKLLEGTEHENLLLDLSGAPLLDSGAELPPGDAVDGVASSSSSPPPPPCSRPRLEKKAAAV